MKIHPYLYKYIAYFMVILMVGGLFVLPVETQEQSPSATFDAYGCVYSQETDSVQIPAVLLGANGEAISQSDYTITVNIPDNEQNVFEGGVNVTPLVERPPLQMILVLDITETVPLQRMIVELQGQFFPQLNADDRVALITFGNTISPMSQFYTYKDRLFEEQLLNLTIQTGDNRMYEALRDAVINMPLNTGQRQVVVMITDSRPRIDQDTTDTPIDNIIEEAVDNNIQIYTVGYYSRDLPDEEGLLRVASETGGYAWFSRDNSTIENIERGIIEQLNNVAQGLNTEVVLDIPLAGVPLNINNQVTLDLEVELLSDPTLTDSVDCFVDRIINTISLVDMTDNLIVAGGQIEIDIAIESSLTDDEYSVAYIVNDLIVQNDDPDDPQCETYCFDASLVDPGLYTFRAELRDEASEVLATSETVTIFAQRLLRLASRENENADVVFDAFIGEEFTFSSPPVQFFAALPDAPDTIYQLTDFGTPLRLADGRASLVVSEEGFLSLPFAPESGNTILVTAQITNLVEGEPELAVSNALEFVIPDFPEPEVIVTPDALILEPEDDLNRGAILYVSSIVFFITLNILLFRQRAREVIKRRIRTPDRYDLDDHLMTVTIQRDGMRQSFRLTKKTVSIGRGSMNDINLGGDSDISRQHGVIMWRKQGWYYTNRKRQVAARIDGKWYKGYVFRKLEPITNIEIGKTHLVFHSSAQQDISEFISTNI